MTPTTTSGAADLRATFSEMLVDLPNTEPFTLFKAGFDAALAAGQATAAPQGVAYADAHGAIMGAAYDFRDAHISGSPNQKRSAHAALESAVTHALRASHGQAPAGAGEPTEQQILEAAFAPAQPAVEASRFGSPELQAMIIARCVEKDQADSVQEDAAERHFFDAGWKACANFCDRDDVRFDGIVGHRGCPQFEEAFRAARKQGATP